jgi:hypothetical protein
MKMRTLFFAAAICLATATSAQTFLTRTGRINFDATTKNSPERVEAKNNEVACIVEPKTGDVRYQVLIKSFKFERALMQEHFNENYMESDKYPKADFKGSIANIHELNLTKDGSYNAKVSGKLTIHGVTNDVTVPGTISVKGNTMEIKAKFMVKLADYNISVPAVVADKLDKIATITVDCQLTQK